jgi:hypothetical protein
LVESINVRILIRLVNLNEGLLEVSDPVAFGYRRGYKAWDEIPVSGQGLVNPSSDQSQWNPSRPKINRENSFSFLFFACLDGLKIRMDDSFLFPSTPFHLSAHDEILTWGKVLGNVGLGMKPYQAKDTGPVGECSYENIPPPLADIFFVQGDELSDKAVLFPYRRLVDLLEVAAVLIAERHMVKEVIDGF